LLTTDETSQIFNFLKFQFSIYESLCQPTSTNFNYSLNYTEDSSSETQSIFLSSNLFNGDLWFDLKLNCNDKLFYEYILFIQQIKILQVGQIDQVISLFKNIQTNFILESEISKLQKEFTMNFNQLSQKVSQLFNISIKDQIICHLIPLKRGGNNEMFNLISLSLSEISQIRNFLFNHLSLSYEVTHPIPHIQLNEFDLWFGFNLFEKEDIFQDYLNFIQQTIQCPLNRIEIILLFFQENRIQFIDNNRYQNFLYDFHIHQGQYRDCIKQIYKTVTDEHSLYHLIPLKWGGNNLLFNLIPLKAHEVLSIQNFLKTFFLSLNEINNL
jgi:5-methylcytosine-specific restriction endonuclease McrA